VAILQQNILPGAEAQTPSKNALLLSFTVSPIKPTNSNNLHIQFSSSMNNSWAYLFLLATMALGFYFLFNP